MQQLVLLSNVKELHVPGSNVLSKIITGTEIGTVKWTNQNGSSFEVGNF